MVFPMSDDDIQTFDDGCRDGISPIDEGPIEFSSVEDGVVEDLEELESQASTEEADDSGSGVRGIDCHSDCHRHGTGYYPNFTPCKVSSFECNQVSFRRLVYLIALGFYRTEPSWL